MIFRIGTLILYFGLSGWIPDLIDAHRDRTDHRHHSSHSLERRTTTSSSATRSNESIADHVLRPLGLVGILWISVVHAGLVPYACAVTWSRVHRTSRRKHGSLCYRQEILVLALTAIQIGFELALDTMMPPCVFAEMD